ncbi:MAG: hypothetical protein U0T81_19740 [Saprospiraceae bacterium]
MGVSYHTPATSGRARSSAIASSFRTVPRTMMVSGVLVRPISPVVRRGTGSNSSSIAKPAMPTSLMAPIAVAPDIPE